MPKTEVTFLNRQVLLQLKWTQRDTESGDYQDNSSLVGWQTPSLVLLPVFIPAPPLAAGLVAAWRCSQMAKENEGTVSVWKAPLCRCAEPNDSRQWGESREEERGGKRGRESDRERLIETATRRKERAAREEKQGDQQERGTGTKQLG